MDLLEEPVDAVEVESQQFHESSHSLVHSPSAVEELVVLVDAGHPTEVLGEHLHRSGTPEDEHLGERGHCAGLVQ